MECRLCRNAFVMEKLSLSFVIYLKLFGNSTRDLNLVLLRELLSLISFKLILKLKDII